MTTLIHWTDSDCSPTIDPRTMMCRVCGVDHSGTCPACGGHGFHTSMCVENGEVPHRRMTTAEKDARSAIAMEAARIQTRIDNAAADAKVQAEAGFTAAEIDTVRCRARAVRS